MPADGLTDGRPSAGFKRVFAWYVRRLVRKRFAAVGRIAKRRNRIDGVAALKRFGPGA